MKETITQSRIEDALAQANAFLGAERGVLLDGGFAAQQLVERVQSVKLAAEGLLTSVPHPRLPGLYVPLSKFNANRFDEAVAVLPGHLVLVPSVLVEPGSAVFYPAVVSEDGLKTGELRLHILRQAYRQKLGYGAAVTLSAAGQSETEGVGDHSRTVTDGIEAEHFATLLAAANDSQLSVAWQSGQHVNHTWRGQQENSVTTEVSKRLFGEDVPQSTITIAKQQVEAGGAILLWHEGMRNLHTGEVETATHDNALLIVQSLGYEALRQNSPSRLDVVKALIS